jgi:putative tryptophan/tyrosine transport system substrate-binding protein
MRRREFITVVGGVAAIWPLVARAQQTDRMRRVGILMPYAKGDVENEARVQAFKQELTKLGWADGR